MAIDFYMEDEEGNELGQVLDPDDLTGRIVALAAHGDTVCLRFIDPEGTTVFNQFQIPSLIREFQAAREHITEDRLRILGEGELASAREAGWAPTLIHAIEVRNQRTKVEDLRVRLDRILVLAERARGQKHTYLKFYGD